MQGRICWCKLIANRLVGFSNIVLTGVFIAKRNFIIPHHIAPETPVPPHNIRGYTYKRVSGHQFLDGVNIVQHFFIAHYFSGKNGCGSNASY